MKLKSIYVLCIIFSALNNIDAQSNWVTFTKANPEEPTVTLLQSNTSAVIFKTETPGMFVEDISKDGIVYQRLQIPKQFTSDKEGFPELPVIKKLIAVAECVDASRTVQINSLMVFNNFMVYYFMIEK